MTYHSGFQTNQRIKIEAFGAVYLLLLVLSDNGLNKQLGDAEILRLVYVKMLMTKTTLDLMRKKDKDMCAFAENGLSKV